MPRWWSVFIESARPRASDAAGVPERGPQTALALLTTSLAVARAAVRIGRLRFEDPTSPASLETLVDRLRRHASTEATWRPDPFLAPKILERLLPLLPPYRLGRCVKRSLYLIELWSRAGLTASLRLGYLPVAGGGRMGHAWVTTNDARLSCLRPNDVVEALRF